MSRVIWLAGSSDELARSLAASTHRALLDAGVEVALVDASAAAGRSRADRAGTLDDLTSGEALLRGIAAEVAAGELGADLLVREAWAGLSCAGLPSAWRSVSHAVGRSEVVVVDGGSLERTRDLVVLPGILERAVSAFLTPRAAMWRSPSGRGHFDVLAALRDEVATWTGLIQSPSTTLRLVTAPESADAHRVVDAAALLAMHGLAVDGLAVHRYPRRREAWPPDVRVEAEAALEVLQEGAQGCAVWRSTSRMRPAPKGRQVLEQLADPGQVPAVRPGSVVLVADGEDYLLDIPLREPARRQARLGTVSHAAVVALDDTHRWWELPPVLRRCRAVDATRTPTGWQVRWTPDVTVWPSSRGTGQGDVT